MNFWRLILVSFVSLIGSGSAQVVINEIHYDPPVKTERSEFIELYNTAETSVSLSGWRLSGGVDFTFPAGSSIPADGYMVIAGDPVAFKARFALTAQGPWLGRLSNEGETITLRNADNRPVDQVDYKLGFPWPTVGEPPGYSIELVNPAFDNDLGGNWRRSVRGIAPPAGQVLISEKSPWKFRKGTSEPSSPISAWRQLSFNDSSWTSGNAPVGYDPSVPMGTTISDMRGSYTSLYFRKNFQVADPSLVGSLRLEALYDDGIQVWINGTRVVNSALPDRDVTFDELATGAARESDNYDSFIINSPGAYLRAGENVVAVQLHNVSLAGSSDCFFDLKLSAQLGSPNSGPTPGARNAVFDTNLPPVIRQVNHSPQQPSSGQPVTITAKITDPDGVASVRLSYQIVDPGSYIDLNDPAYETTWTFVPMRDDGLNGDVVAGDSLYTAILPPSLQVHRRLMRYRFEATDAGNRTLRVPYPDDPQPNFAYFIYDGVPAWNGAIQPGSGTPAQGQVQNFSPAEMSRLPTYHLLAKRTSVEDATWNSRYGGDLYRWWGTLVYDGQVYDHIRYRARGGVWRYAMGKNMWKFDLNRGHEFQARDNYGRKYKTTWKKINLGANIQQGDYLHRGEQGMFESVGFALFNLAGVEAPKTHWINFRIVDEAEEATAGNQYNGDYWGLYLAIEQEDGRFLDEHDLPDGNLYKMEGGTGELNNQGPTAASDKSDLNLFQSTYANTNPTETWWRQNFDLERYYSYHTIVQGIHHYDICDGKNYFYYRNPESGQWSVHTWDLDLTWADNMYRDCDGSDPFRNRVLERAPFNIEFKNRAREIRDLLFNTDEGWKLIDEYAGIVKGTNAGPNILAADRAMWDYNPVLTERANPSKGGVGRFYQFPLESNGNPSRKGSFEATVATMKDYIVRRSTLLDQKSADPLIPSKPTLSYTGPANFPLNRLELRSSAYSGPSAFSAMQWRVGEVRNPAPGVPGIYEIQPVWESSEITRFGETQIVPAEYLKVGHRYRARVRMKDVMGRWSNWSDPVEFTTTEPDNSVALQQFLRPTEIMYNPPAGSEREFVELQNISSNLTLQLSGVAFTDGIDFTFPSGASLAPGEFVVVSKSEPVIFGAFYNLPTGSKVYGPYAGTLSNDGERLTLKTASAGTEIFSLVYNDSGGWPTAPDGAGHSLALRDEALRRANVSLDFPGNWKASSFIGGSPGQADPVTAQSLFINEFAANTVYSDVARPEYDSNDWIELYNAGEPIELRDYYLSDDAANLKKWRLPSVSLGSHQFLTFDEITGFHNPITQGFGLSSSGEEIFLSFLPGTSLDRVVDAVRFKAQERGSTFGRYPDGGPYFYNLNPSHNTPNILAARSLVISEIMYHQPSGETNNSWQEYVEFFNPTVSAIPLNNAAGGYRINGGISFSFPTNGTPASVPPGSTMLLVNFDPANTADRQRFISFYQMDAINTQFAGPFSGSLANGSDRIALEKPQPPERPGDPISWSIIDEAIYTDESGADGDGLSLHRQRLNLSAADPSNLLAAAPSPGSIILRSLDSDRDGIPDDWETLNGLNPQDPNDAQVDSDNDGATNLEEFLAGTNPHDPASRLQLNFTSMQPAPTLQFMAQPGKIYTVEYRESIPNTPWKILKQFQDTIGLVLVQDATPLARERYYRLVVQ